MENLINSKNLEMVVFHVEVPEGTMANYMAST